VEEYTAKTKTIIQWIAKISIGLYIVFFITESFSWMMLICGLAAHVLHLFILRTFPEVRILSLEFIGSVVLLLANHYFAYKHFQDFFYSLSEILGYFTLCLWLVPFALFVSLSANDQVLPTYQEVPGSNDGDVVTNYFSSKKRKNLLSFFKSASESLLPTRSSKKSF